MDKCKAVIATALMTIASSVFLACSVEYALNLVGMNVAVIGALAGGCAYSIFWLAWLSITWFFSKIRADFKEQQDSFRHCFRYVGYPMGLGLIVAELLNEPEFMPGFGEARLFGVGFPLVIYLAFILCNEVLIRLFFTIFEHQFSGVKQVNGVKGHV